MMNESNTATSPSGSGKRRLKGIAELGLGVFEGISYLVRVLARYVWSALSLIGRVLAIAALMPLSLIMLLVTWVADLVSLPVIGLVRSARNDTGPSTAPRSRPRSASIIVVSFNGKHFLEELLPSLRATIEEDGGDHEII